MTAIIETDNCIRLENRYAEIVLSREGAVIEAVIDKAAGRDIKAAEGIPFFILETKEEETIPIRTVSLCDNLLTVETANGAFDLAVTAAEHYFTFEVLHPCPKEPSVHTLPTHDMTTIRQTNRASVPSESL